MAIRRNKPYNGCRIVFVLFFGSNFGIVVGFLSWYHLLCICNSLELESVILHICYIFAWSLCILHRICYIWPCVPSILHGTYHILALLSYCNWLRKFSKHHSNAKILVPVPAIDVDTSSD